MSKLSTLADRGRALALITLLIGIALPAAAQEAAASGASEAGASPEMTDEEALRARVTAYWEARLRASNDTYKFYPPYQEGDERPFEGHALQYTSFTIDEIVIDGDRAYVALTPQLNPYGSISGLLARSLKRAGKDFEVSEEWLRRDGVWYRRPIPAGLSKYHRRSPAGEASSEATPEEAASDATPGEPTAPQGAKAGDEAPAATQ